MGNPLLGFWMRLPGGRGRPGRAASGDPAGPGSRPRPTDLPGAAPDAGPADRPDPDLRGERVRADPGPRPDPGEAAGARLSFFDAFYFMSYTATTIGFGELPYPFTAAQRLWVTRVDLPDRDRLGVRDRLAAALLQDRAFRQALALQQFTRKVARLREPFLLIVGYGRTGELLGRSLDALGRRFVVIDIDAERIERWSWTPTTPTCPAWSPTRATPATCGLAGLAHPDCEAVLALTNDDEANLAVTMTAALLRPELPVIARTVSPPIARPHARLRRRRPWSTRSTGSATTCGSRCAPRPRTS